MLENKAGEWTLLTQEYFEQLAVPSGNTGLIVGQPGDERTYGLTIACNF